MLGSHLLFEEFAVERLWLSAFLASNQRAPYHINLGLSGLVTADHITDIFTVIDEVTAINLRLDPFVLLVGNSDCLAGSPHVGLEFCSVYLPTIDHAASGRHFPGMGNGHAMMSWTTLP